jgi:hypothetical protein
LREKTKLMVKKVHDILIKSEYVKSDELARQCHLNIWSIRLIIKYLRASGIGILPTNKGYILAEFAKVTDDVMFIRGIMGRRASDIMSIHAAEKHIRKRWNNIKGKDNIKNVLEYLSPIQSKTETAQNSLKYLLSYVNSKGS